MPWIEPKGLSRCIIHLSVLLILCAGGCQLRLRVDAHDKSGMSESLGVHSRIRPRPIARCINASALPYGCAS